MATTETKKCSKCGNEKPVKEFYKVSRFKSGISSECKECAYNRNKQYKQQQTQASVMNTIGIDTWEQINSVLREMAETQFAIDREQETCKVRVELIKKYSDEISEHHILHQANFKNMLKTFLKSKLSDVKHSTKKFEFGIITWNNGNLKISLNTALAKTRLGKP